MMLSGVKKAVKKKIVTKPTPKIKPKTNPTGGSLKYNLQFFASKGASESGDNFVYISKNADDVVQYVGITNNFARREAEHLAKKGIKIEPLLNGLSRSDARAVEQTLIEIYGLGKNGGTLMNKINSIAKTNKIFANSLKRG